jgi:hypothetical protein
MEDDATKEMTALRNLSGTGPGANSPTAMKRPDTNRRRLGGLQNRPENYRSL